MFKTRQAGGGFLMIWGAFSAKGIMDLHECNERLNSKKYINILKDKLNLYLKINFKKGSTFQQDNVPVQKAKKVDFF